MSLSLRARLLLLVIVGILPLLGFTLASQYLAYVDAIKHTGERNLMLARNLASAVEQEFGRHIAIMEVMALSPTLRSGDLVGMERGLARLAREKIPGASFALLRPDGERLFDTALPPGAPLPARENLEAARRAIETGSAAVSDLYPGVARRRPVIAIDIPVKREDGGVGYVLSFNPPPDTFERIVGRLQLPPGWFAAVLDRKGVIVARVPNPEEQFVGRQAVSGLLEQAAKNREGVIETKTLEGVSVVTSFVHVDRMGWTAAVAVPKAELTGPASDAAVRTLAVGGGLLLLGIALALAVGRSISRPMDGLRRLVSGGADLGVARSAPTGLREVDVVVEALHTEEERRKQSELRSLVQLEHLNLLDQITRSTGERLDMQSIFQILLGRLEDGLPVEFGCICLRDRGANVLRVACVGAKSATLARATGLEAGTAIDVDADGLPASEEQLVYEPDLAEMPFPLPERLARNGLRSLVLAPLRSESRLFGVLMVARREPHGVSSAECEFLRQLSEHVALAAQQAELYGALQQAYDDLRQAQQVMMQEERLRAMGQMASGIAHDINNALSPASLYAESLLESERNLSERGRSYLEVIQRAVEDVAQTVARMREFYRQRDTQVEFAPVDANDIVRQVVDLTRARWSDMAQQRDAQIRMMTELAPDLPKIMAAGSELREALTNLVFNAIDAMPEGGTLTLRTRFAAADALRPAVVVEVVDTGIGMDEDTRRRCLEPFFTTKGERGTGLGLAMVFGAARRHSADLEIDSTPGAGTTMRLTFAVPAMLPLESDVPASALGPSSRLRLLLVDDDPILLKSLRDTLEGDGHDIVTAHGGKEGIAAFRASLGRGPPFAAVITDLGMPYVDGRQVAAAVKEASPATPVILLTGWGRQMAKEGTLEPNVDLLLAKPPRLRELREALASICRPLPATVAP